MRGKEELERLVMMREEEDRRGRACEGGERNGCERSKLFRTYLDRLVLTDSKCRRRRRRGKEELKGEGRSQIGNVRERERVGGAGK